MKAIKPEVWWRRRRVRWPAALLTGLVLLALTFLACSEYARASRESQPARRLATGTNGRWVETADATLFVQTWGAADRPIVLLTHGTGAWSGTWFDLPHRLVGAGWQVMAVDLPPFGLSTLRGKADGQRYSRAAQARRLDELMRKSDAHITLVGHSFGAGPALEAAMQSGDRVRQLVLIDPALGLGADGHAAVCPAAAGSHPLLGRRTLRTVLIGATATAEPFTKPLLRSFVHRKEVVTDELVKPYRHPFQRIGFSASLGDWAVGFASDDCAGAVSFDPARLTAWSAKGPRVDLIWGERDDITPMAQAKALQGWMPGASLVVLPGVGHIPHIEDPDRLARELIAVLKRPDSP